MSTRRQLIDLRKMVSQCILLGCLLLSFHPLGAFCGEVGRNADGLTVWRSSSNGPDIEYNSDNSIKRIVVRVAQPVRGSGSFAVIEAQEIAEEKAKAAFVRFFHETISIGALIETAESDIERSSSLPNQSPRRQLAENTAEFISSYASGELRGVVAQETGYDNRLGIVWVDVGIRGRSASAAKELEQLMH